MLHAAAPGHQPAGITGQPQCRDPERNAPFCSHHHQCGRDEKKQRQTGPGRCEMCRHASSTLLQCRVARRHAPLETQCLPRCGIVQHIQPFPGSPRGLPTNRRDSSPCHRQDAAVVGQELLLRVRGSQQPPPNAPPPPGGRCALAAASIECTTVHACSITAGKQPNCQRPAPVPSTSVQQQLKARIGLRPVHVTVGFRATRHGRRSPLSLSDPSTITAVVSAGPVPGETTRQRGQAKAWTTLSTAPGLRRVPSHQ